MSYVTVSYGVIHAFGFIPIGYAWKCNGCGVSGTAYGDHLRLLKTINKHTCKEKP